MLMHRAKPPEKLRCPCPSFEEGNPYKKNLRELLLRSSNESEACYECQSYFAIFHRSLLGMPVLL